ncbi:hypothetical protein YPPY90_3424, partial [Yersinia pestis PY-90]
MIKRRVSSI